jgi:WD40 repeat protein
VEESGQAHQTPINNSYRGFTCIAAFDESVLGGIIGSGTIRSFSRDGHEERVFVGHCAQVSGITRISDRLFASRADDSTVRIWDIHQSAPLATILSAQISVGPLTGSGDYIVCGFHNQRIGVVELRQEGPKLLFGLLAQEYIAVAMYFDPPTDTLAMFGVVEQHPMQNNLLFFHGKGETRQRVFRRYSNFIGGHVREEHHKGESATEVAHPPG